MIKSNTFFLGWSTPKKLGFALGLVAIVLLVAALAWWVRRSPEAVLFSDLAERDAAVITAELDKLKLPYGLSADGRSILVTADSVHRTRMAVMGRQLPLHGVVGFELFNHADFGVSDFVQKVNFQRALQGELTRTILAMEAVQDARVHLALPDQTLFKKDQHRSKASVSVTLKPGQRLSDEQVLGIQRLVAASVADIKVDDVTVLDQRGVALSRATGEEAGISAGQLDARRGVETHLARKAMRLLDQMFQPGESLVAVDVVLNHEQSRVTTEELLGATAPDRSSGPAGLMTRERTVTKEPLADSSANASAQVVTQETDYQHGKRIAHTVSQGGQIARLTVAVVVKRSINEAELARLRQLVSSAVGLQPGRGDVVTVHSLAEMGAMQTATPAPVVPAAPIAEQTSTEVMRPPPAADAVSGRRDAAYAIGATLVAAALAALAWAAWWRRASASSRCAAVLTDLDREVVLKSVRRWLEPQS